jgi:hypothetical protein
MAVLFDTQSVHFPSLVGSDAFQVLEFRFPGTINKASAMLSGALWGFTSSEHPIFRQAITAEILSAQGSNTAVVQVGMAIRDHSGFFDDSYDGDVAVTVIADVT